MLARPTQPAADLLLWCARAAAAPDVTLSQEAMTGPSIDGFDSRTWSQFLRESSRHMMLPLCWRALERFHDRIPPLVASDLHVAFEQNARRNLWLSAELVRMLSTLQAAGVAAVPWKGPLLAERAYGDLKLRQFFDLDILVRSADMRAARDTLLAAGFRPEKPMTAAQQDAYIEHQGELELVRDEDGLWIELHTQIVPTYYGRGTRSEELWQRVQAARLGRSSVSALDPVDEMEALCVHGSKHRWDRLLWIVDVALMARLLADDDWRRLAAGARAHGTRRMVHIGLLLAADLSGAVIPGAVVGAARADRVAGALAAEVAEHLFEPRSNRFDSLFFHARMRERPRHRVQYLFNVLFTPSGADWEAFALPRPLFPLYALTRPVRLAFKYGRRMLLRENISVGS